MTFRRALVLASLALATLPAHADLDGKAAFEANCIACHGAGGAGVPGVAPPLARALDRHLASPQAATYFAQIVAGGLNGPIRAADGETYNGVMPVFGTHASEELAAILRYVTTGLNDAPAGFDLGAADIDAARARKPTPADNRALRAVLLKAAPR
ncbi:c-type cytochrome [Derxia gummosa]|uniref:C-type cytochrome n=1 Tax=Derxia gummosa DSM 723 TaxID=1121388 RepID=A0A8B6X4D2_9BURK|nr:c-type cytochrome [Derxia gummosa]